MAYLRLPERLRDELKKPTGIIAKDISELGIKPDDIIITIGDRVTEDALLGGFIPKICVYDNRIERRSVPVSKKITDLPAEKIMIKNPQGSLNEEVFGILRKALSSKKNIKIEVDGEEDLIAVAAMDVAPIGAVVLYGQPGEGVVCVRIDKKTKEMIKGIIKEMQNENRDKGG
jgi:uncharacterized protein (UPF0218 family)